MKKLLFLLFILAASYSISAQVPELDKLIEEKKFTELNNRLKNGKTAGGTHDIYQAVVLNVFGKAAESNRLIEKVLSTHGRSLSDSQMHRLLEAQHSNYVKLFNYKKAYQTKKHLMDKYPSFTEEKDVFDEQLGSMPL